VAPFRPAGTQELADGAVRCLIEHGGRAAILQNHGVVGIGRDLAEALKTCIEVERHAARFVRRIDAV
jgi:L-fuculose-phosphate aldolase